MATRAQETELVNRMIKQLTAKELLLRITRCSALIVSGRKSIRDYKPGPPNCEDDKRSGIISHTCIDKP